MYHILNRAGCYAFVDKAHKGIKTITSCITSQYIRHLVVVLMKDGSVFDTEMKTETLMKTSALIFTVLMILAGCSASYKGDIKGANDPAAANSERTLICHSGETQSSASADK
jgi:hypothetical protein